MSVISSPLFIKKNDMEITELSAKHALAEFANKLFMYADAQHWSLLVQEVFAKEVWFDMKSAGGAESAHITANGICDRWKQGFQGLDAVHHQAGKYLITLQDQTADIYAYTVATHYKKAATKGQIRVMTGSYDLKAQQTNDGWRLTQFKYNLKYTVGNLTMV